MISRAWQSVAAFGCLGMLLLSPAVVVAEDDMGVTMRMVTDDADLTESVVREIELREPVALELRTTGEGKPGDTPRAAPGSDQAREARERGREAARAGAERAREVRDQNNGRERPEQPELPEKPERPDVSKRPERPELP